MNEKRPKREPNAEMRQAASQMYQLYVALVDEGFTEQQALVILGQMMPGGKGGNA